MNKKIRSIVKQDQATLVNYQPGNGTKYLVLFQKLPAEICMEIGGYEEPGTLVTVVNLHEASLFVPGYTGSVSLSYFMEKTGFSEGDAAPLVELINHRMFPRRQGLQSTPCRLV